KKSNGSKKGRMRFLLLGLFALLAMTVVASDAASEVYELQRRVGVAGDWESISSMTISRGPVGATAKLKQNKDAQDSGKDIDLTKEKKTALAKAQFVYYRLVRKGDKDGINAVSVVLTPCSLVRDFDALDSRTVVLRESLRVAVGPDATVVGLQATSGTNTFHAKMLNGDECDLSILSLFPNVRMRVRKQKRKDEVFTFGLICPAGHDCGGLRCRLRGVRTAASRGSCG
ncbi:hypothetical protein TCSYLVIO_007257, partial [Trypanosoma cruzi]